MKAALYVRTSTVDQTVDNQVRELEAVAERLGHEIVEVYADNGISGAKGRDRRPGWESCSGRKSPDGAHSSSQWA
jgi:DNA invertase Pin-like site-specific DNA recombinase